MNIEGNRDKGNIRRLIRIKVNFIIVYKHVKTLRKLIVRK